MARWRCVRSGARSLGQVADYVPEHNGRRRLDYCPTVTHASAPVARRRFQHRVRSELRNMSAYILVALRR
jgi:hypothetical protein